MLQVTITNGPQDITVYEGATAMFPCSIVGAASVPFWYIDDSRYDFRSLPDRHSFSLENKTLIVSEVKISDNGTAYKCSVFVATSNPGVLTVIAVEFPDGK
jgi:hypothetical protein